MRGLLKTITASAVVFAATYAFALEVPVLKGRVNDYGDMISPAVEAELEQKLKAFENSDSTQIVILTVSSLEGDSLEDFTIRVAEKWKIGQAKKDNGVIIFAAKNDKKMRIEVGRGLEGVLTDLLTGRILDNVIRPKFRAADFDGGFTAGVDSIILASRGEFKNDGAPSSQVKSSSPGKFFIIMLFVLYFAVMIFSRISKIIGGGIGAAALPAIVHYGLTPLGLAGVAGLAVFGFIAALILPYLPVGGGGFIGGSGGSGSGGFSGGGGSFGGGGSSGEW